MNNKKQNFLNYIIKECGYNKTELAPYLKMSIPTLYKKTKDPMLFTLRELDVLVDLFNKKNMSDLTSPELLKQLLFCEGKSKLKTLNFTNKNKTNGTI